MKSEDLIRIRHMLDAIREVRKNEGSHLNF
jgi:hypothetical protein